MLSKGSDIWVRLIKEAHCSHEAFAEEKRADPIFIDRDPEPFSVILNYLRDGKINLTRSAVDITRIREDAKFYGIEPLVDKLRHEESHLVPFFAGESVVWRDPDIRRLCTDIGIHFDGTTDKLPLCLNAFRDIEGEFM
ncbi:K+ channel tetramerization domain protein, partial [Trichostrongylus colubriformis]